MLTEPLTMLHVRATLAADRVREDAAAAAQRRVDRLRDDDEAGAQAAEYAMLGGVSAAACGGLVYILKETDALERIVGTVVETLTSTIGRWF